MNQTSVLKSISPLIPGGKDLKATIAFYERQLGFRCIHKEGDPMHMAIIQRDSTQIFLIQNEDKHLAEGTSLRIQVEGIDRLYQEFQNQGGSMIHPDGKLEKKPWGVNEFVVLDPMGVCITFYEMLKT